jgi:hypothetical protein
VMFGWLWDKEPERRVNRRTGDEVYVLRDDGDTLTVTHSYTDWKQQKAWCAGDKLHSSRIFRPWRWVKRRLGVV